MEVNCILMGSFIIYNGLGVVLPLSTWHTKTRTISPWPRQKAQLLNGEHHLHRGFGREPLVLTLNCADKSPSAGRRILRQRVSGWNSMNLSNSQVQAFSQMGSLLSKLSDQAVSGTLNIVPL